MPERLAQQSLRTQFDLAQQFVDRAQLVENAADLSRLMDAICHELGFRHYALIHHTDLRRPLPGIVNLNNYPPVWADYFVKQQLYKIDPVVHACFRRNTAFSWSSLPELIPLNTRHRLVLEGAAREGLSEGITVPACAKGEHSGSCSLAAPRNLRQYRRCRLAAQLVGAFGFEAARQLAKGPTLNDAVRLSPRQRECIILVGQGKSNWEIAKILGLSPVTIGHYLADARQRYDVTRREQLVVRALLDNEISFAELLPAQYVQVSG